MIFEVELYKRKFNNSQSMHISSTYYKSQNDVAAICPGNIKIVNQRKLQWQSNQQASDLRMYLYNQAKTYDHQISACGARFCLDCNGVTHLH